MTKTRNSKGTIGFSGPKLFRKNTSKIYHIVFNFHVSDATGATGKRRSVALLLPNFHIGFHWNHFRVFEFNYSRNLCFCIFYKEKFMKFMALTEFWYHGLELDAMINISWILYSMICCLVQSRFEFDQIPDIHIDPLPLQINRFSTRVWDWTKKLIRPRKFILSRSNVGLIISRPCCH